MIDFLTAYLRNTIGVTIIVILGNVIPCNINFFSRSVSLCLSFSVSVSLSETSPYKYHFKVESSCIIFRQI